MSGSWLDRHTIHAYGRAAQTTQVAARSGSRRTTSRQAYSSVNAKAGVVRITSGQWLAGLSPYTPATATSRRVIGFAAASWHSARTTKKSSAFSV
jgi:hypothetical protein